jgi:signal transduction histidine kinase
VPWSDPAAVAVEDRLFRALAVLRIVVLVNAVALNLWRHDNFEHPAAGVAAVVAMSAWTVFAIAAYRTAGRRTVALLAADLAVAVGAILVSPWIKGEDMRATVPGFWVMGALMAWAIHFRWKGGLFAGLCLAAADLGVRSQVTQANYGNLFLLAIGGPIVGYMCELLQLSAVERDRAERSAAAAAERARLSRVVHDGVLQVLALVQRRGTELGGDFAELGRMAGEQETALRSLIRQQSSTTASAGDVDLTAALEALELSHPPVVSVATTGGPVEMEEARAAELVAAVRACLDNVAVHVGLTAPAWVLLEQVGDTVVVTVRDEGPGIPEGRLAEALTEGRLGVAESIRGRVEDLGGTATLSTGGFGTEWELSVRVGAGSVGSRHG